MYTVEMYARVRRAVLVEGQSQRVAALFRQVQALNPDHDGATLQLAKVLDQRGKPEEALPGAMAEFIEHYNQRHYHEGLGDVASARVTRVGRLVCQDKVQFRQLATGLYVQLPAKKLPEPAI